MNVDGNVLTIDTILPNLKAGNQKRAFHVITEYAAKHTGIEQIKLYNRLMAQERTTSCSGIGGGVAILQITAKLIKEPYLLFAKAQTPLDYDSVDGNPVDLFALVISPEEDGPVHLQRLAKFSRLLRDTELCKKLRGIDDLDTIRALLSGMTETSLAA